MSDRKPVTLDDLDRDELLALVRERYCIFQMEDLIWAQWQVACKRRQKATEAALAMFDEVIPASKRLDATFNDYCEQGGEARNQAYLRARAEYDEITARQKKLEATADRFDRRADRLLARHKELRGEA